MAQNKGPFFAGLGLIVLGLVVAAYFALSAAIAGVGPFDQLISLGGFAAQAFWVYGGSILVAAILVGVGLTLVVRSRRRSSSS